MIFWATPLANPAITMVNATMAAAMVAIMVFALTIHTVILITTPSHGSGGPWPPFASSCASSLSSAAPSVEEDRWNLPPPCIWLIMPIPVPLASNLTSYTFSSNLVWLSSSNTSRCQVPSSNTLNSPSSNMLSSPSSNTLSSPSNNTCPCNNPWNRMK